MWRHHPFGRTGSALQDRYPLSLASRLTVFAFVCLGLVTPVRGDDDSVHTVVPRDSLWSLADKYLLDPLRWPELWKLNTYIIDPDLIYVGDQIRWRIADSLADNAAAAVEESSPNIGSLLTLSDNDDEPAADDSSSALPDISAPDISALVDKAAGLSPGSVADSGADADQAPATDSGAAGYVDQLIDPSAAEDDDLGYLFSVERTGKLATIDQSLQLVGQYRASNQGFDSTFDSGLHYIARKNTDNWGQLRLNLVAVDESRFSPSLNQLNGQTSNNGFEGKSGLARLSLEQYNLPLTENISMDNILGTHRQARYNPFRQRPNLVNSRFSAAEPDVLGVSSQIKFGRSGVGASFGKLGQNRGTLLPGFNRTEGNIKRLQFTHVRERNAISADLWRTDKQNLIDNRTGFRLSYDHLLSARTAFSLTGAASDDRYAFLVGGSTETSRSKHDYGVYYFDSDVIWLDARIGDDNVGSFYRYNTRRGRHTFGASLELRRDGLSDTSSVRTETGFLSLNLSRRVSRRTNLSALYNYRQVETRSGLRDTVREHTLRSYLTRNHRSNSNSNYGAILRLRNDSKEVQLDYGWTKDFNTDSTLQLAANYRRTFDSLATSRQAVINGSWSKQFERGSFLSLGLGYNHGRSGSDRNRGLTGFINYDQPVTRNLALSVQLDYNRNESDLDFDEDISDTLFTDNQFNDDLFGTSRQFSAFASLTYRRGGRSRSRAVLGSGRGTGRVQGSLFVDNNGDGIRQQNEPGLAGVTVYLNSVYPVVTDAQGIYRFPSVGIGEHFLFIDETTLPLPWTLVDGEYTPLTVDLRRTTSLDIAVSPINLAEAE